MDDKKFKKKFIIKMPDTKDVLAAWNLTKGSQIIGPYTVTVAAKHLVIQRNMEYGFPIKIKFHSIKKVSEQEWKQFQDEMYEKLKGQKVVNSRFGNPYLCQLGTPRFVISKDRSYGFIELEGKGIRV